MSRGCPFYGCHWPDRRSILTYGGGNACGLDIDRNAPCSMEKEGRAPNYFACPAALDAKPLLQPARHLISFASPGELPYSLAEWEDHKRK